MPWPAMANDETMCEEGQGQRPVSHEGWFFLGPSHVPARWRERAVPVFLVPLLPQEAGRVLEGGEPGLPQVGREEERLLELIARGRSVSQMARAEGISSRGIQHRLGRLRRRFGVASTSELAALLARRGLPGSDESPGGTHANHRATGDDEEQPE